VALGPTFVDKVLLMHDRAFGLSRNEPYLVTLAGESNGREGPVTSPAESLSSAPAPAESRLGAIARAGLRETISSIDRYHLQIRERIESQLFYPVSLQRRGVSGRVRLRLVLDPGGQLLVSEVIQSSGFAQLDILALDAVRAAAPFPKPGPKFKSMGKLSLNLPVEFRIQ
jgi:periplasmic protein TonB